MVFDLLNTVFFFFIPGLQVLDVLISRAGSLSDEHNTDRQKKKT